MALEVVGEDAFATATPSRPATPAGVLGWLDRLQDAVLIALIVAMAAVVNLQVISRYVFDRPFMWAEEVTRLTLVWVTFLGGSLLFRRGSEILVDSFVALLPARARFWADLLRDLVLVALYGLVLVVAWRVAGSVGAMPLIATDWPTSLLVWPVCIGAAFTIFYAVLRIHASLRAGGARVTLTYVAALLALLFAGIPVAASLLVVGGAAMWLAGVPLATAGQRLAFGVDNFTLIAVPMFLLMGNLMNASGITQRIFDFAVAMVGHWRAGLAQVNVLGSLVFSGMSGSALADAAGLGSVEIRAMRMKGYTAQFSAAVTAVSATVGPVIPPSTVGVLYAYIADVSVGRLFLSGVVPGLMMVVVQMLIIHRKGKFMQLPAFQRANWPQKARATWVALPALVVPFAMLFGMRTGVFTATEVAAVGALYAVILAGFYHRTTSRSDVIGAFRDTALSTGGIMLILASANVFAWIVARERLPQAITQAILQMHLQPWLLLLVLNLLLLVLGMLLDTAAILVLVTPVVVPALVAVGVDPVHFGMVMIVNMMIGLLTPPVGMALFIVSNISGASVMSVARECVPFVIGFLVVLAIITFIPDTVLWLPDLVYGKAIK